MRVALASPEACTDSGKQVFERGDVFFGEIIAHTPQYDDETGVFLCTAYAVWGCPAPTGGPEETATGY